MNDVEPPLEDLCNTSRLEKGETGLVGRDRREETEGARQAVHGHIGVVFVALLRLQACKETVGIDAVDDLNPVSAPGQLIGEMMDEDSISPEVVRWIKGRDHTEAKGSIGRNSAPETRFSHDVPVTPEKVSERPLLRALCLRSKHCQDRPADRQAC